MGLRKLAVPLTNRAWLVIEKPHVLGVLCAMAISVSGIPKAQAQEEEQEQEDIEVIEVTGTRVIRDGYSAPTPTTVLGEEALDVFASENIANAVNVLPPLAGSTTPTTSTQAVSSGGAGMNNLELRAMGANRTLVLLDGRRIAPTVLSGAADINQLPSGLVERVEVVTGGASAAYGSDALTGVVNFILDKDFTGLETDVQLGTSAEGDNDQYEVSVAAGTPLASDRAHILVSAEYSDVDGVFFNPRDWHNGWNILRNPNYTESNGRPEFLLLPFVGVSNATPGALITSGPLQGTQFGPGGEVRQFQYGRLISGPVMVGGDWRISEMASHTDIAAAVQRQSVFTRASFDLTDDIELFTQIAYGKSETESHCCFHFDLGNLTIQRDNAFLPAEIGAQMDALGLTSFSAGSWNRDLGPITSFAERETTTYLLGAEGALEMAGTTWIWEVYAQAGTSNRHNKIPLRVNANFQNAIDAVRTAGGEIVCRSTITNPNNGCVPYNVLGTNVNSAEAIDYVMGLDTFEQEITQDVAAASLSGDPFSTWAGPVSLAGGVEYREEAVDSQSNPIALDNGFFAANFKETRGSYDVLEGFLETVVPLAAEEPWAHGLDLNAAVRWTDYSITGQVTTWKVGGTYSPTPDLTFRVTRSRDFRAPNLQELFAPGIVNTRIVRDPFRNNETATILRPVTGNVNLDPEEGDTTGFGIIYEPSVVPGLSMSVDYYQIEIANAIGTVGEQEILDRCFDGEETFCTTIVRDSEGQLISVASAPFNFVKETAEGLDIEASYPVSLGDGELTLRALATHVLTRETDEGEQTNDLAGANTGSAPDWRFLGIVGYERGPLDLTIIGRGVSDGVLSNSFIVCTTGCPVSTTAHPTINYNKVEGAFYLDLSVAYRLLNFDQDVELFLKVNNLADVEPPVAPDFGTNQPLEVASNPSLYDTIGRMYRAGVRVSWW